MINGLIAALTAFIMAFSGYFTLQAAQESPFIGGADEPVVTVLTENGPPEKSTSVLPAWTCTGEDPLENAVAEYTLRFGDYGMRMEGCATVPAPVILRTDRSDETHATVYGSFWFFNYADDNGVLTSISGGENPGVLTLELTDGAWRVTGEKLAGDGKYYAEDIRSFCEGDDTLESRYYACADASSDPVKSVREKYLREYVRANGLEISAYRDPYWDAVPLEP